MRPESQHGRTGPPLLEAIGASFAALALTGSLALGVGRIVAGSHCDEQQPREAASAPGDTSGTETQHGGTDTSTLTSPDRHIFCRIDDSAAPVLSLALIGGCALYVVGNSASGEEIY